ncbi:MAG TPA: hypothetical protein VNX01_03420 [Bacteroidia bacterium]|jgi:hypothetical protein|nr:hypothetical protein [Bacteroidia bacterium]
MINSKKLHIAILFLAAIISCYIGFINKYPLVYPDTGTYLHSGFSGQVPHDRTIFYGLFARHISLYASLWLVILAQGLLVCYMLYTTLGLFFKDEKRNYIFISSVLFLTLTTGFSYTVSILIPDIFSSIAILCLINLLLNNNLGKLQTIFISILFVFSITTHLSNIPILIILLLILVGIGIYKKVKKSTFILPLKKLVLSLSLFVSSLLIIPTVHYLFDNKFQLANGSHVFMMNHLIETGILEDYLNTNCEHSNYKICNYKDELSWNFVWREDSPLYKTGGWEVNKTEYNAIIFDILTTPKYFILFVQKSIEYSFKQYFTFGISVNAPLLEHSPPYGMINWFFKNSKTEYLSSLQNRSNLDVSFNNKIQEYIILTSMFFLFFILINSSLRKHLGYKLKWMIAIVVIHGIISSIICANIATIDPRFQNRIVWLLPLCTIIVVIKFFEEKRDLTKSVGSY